MTSNPLNMNLFELDKNESCWLSIPAVVEFLTMDLRENVLWFV